MGMYDSVSVHRSLLSHLCETNNFDFLLEGDYYSFQTKDLDNALSLFYIQSDGSFVEQQQDHRHVESKSSDQSKWNFGHMEPLGKPRMVPDTRSAYIEFYDFYSTDKERCFVTFVAHVKGGSLQEPIKVKKIECDNLEEERQRHAEARKRWDAVTDTWEWQAATFILEAKWMIRKMFLPLITWINDIESDLRQKAQNKFHDTTNQ